MTSELTRREALRRAAWVLGGTISAPTILGVLAGCGGTEKTVLVPRTLTTHQRDMVLTIAETIIPETDTPGARSARIDEFVDAMLTDHYPTADRERFLTGLARIDTRAQRAHKLDFEKLTPAQREAMVVEMDRVAFSDVKRPAGGPAAPEASPDVRQGDVATGQGVGADPKEAATPPPDPSDVGPKSFFRMMKELAVVGYYTSEVGSTRELRVNPMVRYRDIPYTPGTPTWA